MSAWRTTSLWQMMTMCLFGRRGCCSRCRRADSPVAGRERSGADLGPGPRVPVNGASPAPTPGFTFVRTKVNRKSAKTKVLDSFAQSDAPRPDPALPLNHQFLRGSGLWRVSGPASAVALLKGKMDQPLHTKKYPSSRGPSGEDRSPPHRLRESRRPRSISVAARYQSRSVRLGKKRGSSPKGAGAFSVHFCAYKSEPRGPGLGKPRQ